MKIYENLSLSNINNLYQKQTNHFLEKSKKIKLETYPYYFFENNNLFHDDFYQYLKSLFPPMENMKKLNETKFVGQNYPSERYSYVIKNYRDQFQSLYNVETNSKLTFNLVKLSKWFSTIFKKTMLDIFEIEDSKNINDELGFFIDTKGYKLTPHTDINRKIITCLIYMPDTDNLANFGTNILIPKDTFDSRNVKDNMSYRNEQFEIIRTTKFVEKNIFSFKRSNSSFHSVSEFTKDDERKFLLFTIFNSKA